MMVKRIDYENLMIEIPEENSKPLVVSWMDSKGKVVDKFEVGSEEEDKFEDFMKDLIVEEKILEKSVALSWVKRQFRMFLPKKFAEYSGLVPEKKYEIELTLTSRRSGRFKIIEVET